MRRVGIRGLLIRRRWRVPVLLGLALGVLLLEAASASAVVGRRPPPKRPTVRGNTQMIVTGWTPGQSVTGFIADGSSTFDPTKDPYPAFSAANPPSPANPPADFTPKDEGYAGLIQGTPTAGGATLTVYCIDIITDTTVGIGYVLGSWEASGVPNVGFVERILNEYYPHNPNLPALANPNEKAAAVQAAIWFFSDKYVLSTDDPLHDTVAGIVEQIQDEGALPAPAPPTLTLTPSSLSAPGKGSVIGPFRVNTNQPSVTVDATGGTMYSAAAALPADQLGDGTMAGSALHRRAPGDLDGGGPERKRLALRRQHRGVG